EVAVEQGVELVDREVDPVIGDTVLAEVVRADLLGTIARPDLAAALLRDGLLLPPQFHLVELRPQHLHRLRLVLDLRLLVLLRDDDAGRDVGDAHGRIGGVDALAAGTTRTERVDAQVLRIDLDVDFFGFRQDGHRGRRRVDTSAGFGYRHALHAMDAALELQAPVHAPSLDAGHDFPHAANTRLIRGEDFDLPALAFRKTRVHPEEIAGEQPRFFATGPGADFDHDVAVVIGILRNQQHAQPLFEIFDGRLEGGNFVGREGPQVGVVAVGQFTRFVEGAHLLLVGPERLDQFLRVGDRLRVRAIGGRVGLHRRVAHQ